MTTQGKPPVKIEFAEGCSPVCDVVRRPKRRKRKSRPFHRMLGGLTALPLVWVLITGFFLNHSEDFDLDAKMVSHPWVLSAYGMLPDGDAHQIELAGKVLSEWDGVVFCDSKVIENVAALGSAAVDGAGIVVLADGGIIRYDAAGEEIERLDELSLPGVPVTGLANDQDRVLLQTQGSWYQADAEWLEFVKIEGQFQSRVPELVQDQAVLEQLQREWSGGGVSMGRVVLDLHAGNFLGDFAKYFYDLVILCTLFLIGTGLLLQWRSNGRGRNNGKS